MYALLTAFLAIGLVMGLNGIEASLFARDPAIRNLAMDNKRNLLRDTPVTVTVITTVFPTSCSPAASAVGSAGTPAAGASTTNVLEGSSKASAGVTPTATIAGSSPTGSGPAGPAGPVGPVVPISTSGSTSGSAGPVASSSPTNASADASSTNAAAAASSTAAAAVTILGSTTAPVPSIPATTSSAPLQTAGSGKFSADPHVLAAFGVALGMAFMA